MSKTVEVTETDEKIIEKEDNGWDLIKSEVNIKADGGGMLYTFVSYSKDGYDNIGLRDSSSSYVKCFA